MQQLGIVRLDARGRVASIRPAHRDLPLMEAEPESRLPLVLAWLEEQEPPVADWHVEPAGDETVLLRSTLGDELELVLETVPLSGHPLLRAELTNRGHAPVQRLRFQIGGALDIGPGPQLTYPANSGWRIPLAALGPDEVLRLDYPVHASMQWADLYTGTEGMYLGVQDPLPYLKALLVGRQHGQPYMAWEYPHLRLEPGQVFRFPLLHLAWHRGDWRAGADLYRAWVKPYIARPDPPPWYRSKPAWNWVGLRGQNEPAPWHHADELPTLSAQASALGPDLIQLTAYTEHGHDTGYPDYAVGPSLGGLEAARRAVRAIHSAGRRISVYTNGRLADPGSSLSADARGDWGVRAETGGRVWQETYGQVTFDVMCPSVQAWNNLFIANIVSLVRRHGFDGVYIDQVCGAPALPCYAASHPHGRPNEAWATYKPFVASLRLALRAANAECFLATEGVNDLLGQHFDSMQSHEDWDREMEGRGRLLPELYRYTLPDHLLNVGCIRANDEQYLFLGHALGSGFDFGIQEFDTLTARFLRVAGWILAQRAKNEAMLRGASFCLLPEVDAQAYRANAFLKGGQLLILGAPLAAPSGGTPPAVEIAVPWPHDDRPAEGTAESPEGAADVPIEHRGDRLYVVLPADRPTAVTLSARGDIQGQRE